MEKLAKPLVALAHKNGPSMFMTNAGLGMNLYSESGMSQWMAAGTGGRLVYSGTHGWMVNDDETGAFTADHAEDVLFQVLREYQGKLLESVSLVTDLEDQRKAFRFYQTLLGASCQRAVIELLRHEPGVSILPVEFDRDDSIINCCGIVVSTDGLQRAATPEDLFTMSAAVRPESGVPVEFLKFLDWMTCGITALRDWILTALGIALFGHVTSRIINFYGHGSNGKGTLLRTFYRVMGGYATTIARPLVIKEPGNGSRFDKANLPGKRAAILFDLKVDRGRLNLDELKSIAGDGDVVPIEKKNKDAYDGRLKCKIFMASNEKIPIDSYGDSEKRRFYLVPFNAHVESKDEALEDSFIPEYGKILNLLLEYATNYYANGRKMPSCKEIDTATEDYFNSQDLISQFINDECTLDPLAIVRKTELYEKFVSYCQDEHGINKPGSSKKFADALEKRGITEGIKKIGGKTSRVFLGIISEKVTGLQRNANSDLLPLENPLRETNTNFENSCNPVTSEAKNSPSEGDNFGAFGPSVEAVPGNGGPYDSPGQRALWEDPEAVLY